MSERFVYLSMSTGLQIRKHRLMQKRTLQEIADKCGLTKSMISKIENDRVVPAVSTLMKISQALGVKVSTLLGEDMENKTVYTPGKENWGDKMIKSNIGYYFRIIAGERIDKQFQPFLFYMKKGNVKKHKLNHSGEEFVYMLEGSMKYRVGNIEYVLNPGDSIYFDSCEEHEVHPVSEEVKYLAIFSVPGTEKS